MCAWKPHSLPGPLAALSTPFPRGLPLSLYEAAVRTALEDAAQACQARIPGRSLALTSAYHAPWSGSSEPLSRLGTLWGQALCHGSLGTCRSLRRRVDTECKHAEVKSGGDGSRGSVLTLADRTVGSRGGGVAPRGARPVSPPLVAGDQCDAGSCSSVPCASFSRMVCPEGCHCAPESRSMCSEAPRRSWTSVPCCPLTPAGPPTRASPPQLTLLHPHL